MEENQKQEGFLYSLDLFRFTPSKFLEQTVLGALISIATVAFSIYLIMHEVDLTLNNDVKNEILFENLHMTDLRVQLDIDMIDIPCDVVDLRFTAKRGRAHSVERYRLRKDEQGEFVPEGSPMRKAQGIEEIVEAIKRKDGCKIKGEFYMHFLSNNIYLGYGNALLLSAATSRIDGPFVPSLNHRINSLTFGTKVRSEKLKEKFELKGLDTLGKHELVEDRKDGFGGPYYHSYYVVAVPNIFDRMFGRILETFQYTASGYSRRNINSGVTFR